MRLDFYLVLLFLAVLARGEIPWKIRLYPWWNQAGFCNASQTCDCSAFPATSELTLMQVTKTWLGNHDCIYDLGIISPQSQSDAATYCKADCSDYIIQYRLNKIALTKGCGKRYGNSTGPCYFYTRLASINQVPSNYFHEYVLQNDFKCAHGLPVGASQFIVEGKSSASLPTIRTIAGTLSVCLHPACEVCDPRYSPATTVVNNTVYYLRNSSCISPTTGQCDVNVIPKSDNYLHSEACVPLGSRCESAYKALQWILPDTETATFSVTTLWASGSDGSCYRYSRWYVSTIATASAPTTTPTPTPSPSESPTATPPGLLLNLTSISNRTMISGSSTSRPWLLLIFASFFLFKFFQ